MKKYLLYIIGVFFILSCGSTKLKVKVWQHPSFDSNKIMHPEKKDSILSFAKLKGVPTDSTFGIVFSGGGTRSASAVLGQLQALDSLGWIQKAHYVAAVSGGSWATVPFIYLPKEYSNQEYLGTYTPPDQLTEEILKGDNSGMLSKNISDAGLLGRVFVGGVTGKLDETYSYSLGRIFLKPFGLDDRNKFFTQDERSLSEILDANKNFKKEDFYTIEHKNRPFLIVGATLQRKYSGIFSMKRDLFDIYPLEITPLYTGVPTAREFNDFRSSNYYRKKGKIGGGYIESIGYDSDAPKEIAFEKRTTVKIKNKRAKFTLSDVIGTSGAAPQKTLTGPVSRIGKLLYVGGIILTWKSNLDLKYKIGITTLGTFFVGMPSFNIIGFPEFNHWPIDSTEIYLKENEYSHGDGGNIDNIGLLPLLSRRVKNIIVFVNTATPFRPNGNYPISSDFIYEDLISYFVASPNRPFNKVFDELKLFDLYKDLEKRKIEGRPLVSCSEYKVRANTWFNIKPYIANICWVYLDRSKTWIDIISENKSIGKYRELISQGKGIRFSNFPHYRTFLQKWYTFRVIKLNSEQVNTLSNLTAWTVFEEKKYLSKNLFK